MQGTASKFTTWKNSPRSASIGPTLASSSLLKSSGVCNESVAECKSPVTTAKNASISSWVWPTGRCDGDQPPRNSFRLLEGWVAGRKSRYGLPSRYCRLEARTWKLLIWQMVTRVFAVVSGLLHSTTNRLQTPENFRRLFGNPKIFSHVFTLMAIIAKWT